MDIQRLLARRTDLSTFLVHLTKSGDGQSAKNRLINILRTHMIEARNPFGPAVQRLVNAEQSTDSQNCVCFTETPLEHVHILTSEIDDRDYHFEPYGIAITKKQGRRVGANPVWYLDITPGHNWLTVPLEQMIDGAIAGENFAAHPLLRLTPFIEQMGRGQHADGQRGYMKEFWWEREWRHRGNFDIAGKLIVLCPVADMNDIKQALAAEEINWIANPSFIDPQWGLEQIIGGLAGYDMGDLGAF